ncbi:MAG TPA: adenylate/guanylate cyclase domain-containing protein [Acidimicrobiales bacterium]|nr:adenylate/guanylate cyclase domain-containing protein [Acidimicrobiales bacterium]
MSEQPGRTARPESEELARVWAFLLDRGVPADDIHRAEGEHSLHLLVMEQLIVPQRPRYTPVEVAELAGMSLDEVRRYWRSLGFPDVPDDVVAFSDYDLEALATVSGLLSFRMVDEAVAAQMARVIGSSMARIAEAEITASPVLTGEADDLARAELLMATADATIPSLARLLEYAWRRHMQAAARRALLLRGTEDPSGAAATFELAIGFADLVGYTALSQQLNERELAEMVGRFEELAYDVVVRGNGRVVKMIGDEAMFVCADAADAVRIALDLSDAYASDETLSDVRVGVACGPVLAREGDYYGPVVNLASRIVNIANPGSVLVSEAVHAVLRDDESVAWKPLRARYLKEIGRVPLWSVARAGADDAEAPSTKRERFKQRVRPGRFPLAPQEP